MSNILNIAEAFEFIPSNARKARPLMNLGTAELAHEAVSEGNVEAQVELALRGRIWDGRKVAVSKAGEVYFPKLTKALVEWEPEESLLENVMLAAAEQAVARKAAKAGRERKSAKAPEQAQAQAQAPAPATDKAGLIAATVQALVAAGADAATIAATVRALA